MCVGDFPDNLKMAKVATLAMSLSGGNEIATDCRPIPVPTP